MNKIFTIFITLLISSFSYSQCKDIFIGNVYQFKNIDEYYINIFFNEGFKYKSSINTIMDNLDLLVFEDDGISRKRIKIDCATKYFNLKGLDTIYFYNNYNELIGSGIFKRAEYVDYIIEEDFIAVYKPSRSNYSQKPYYASNCKKSFIKTGLVKSENKKIENKIIETYKIDRNSIIETSHFTYSMDKADYSIISYDFPYLNSILVKHKEGKLIKLYETGKDYIFDDFFITAFEFNNKPIFIAGFKRPESDYYFTASLFYDGEGYDFKRGDRSGSENTKGDFNGDGVYEYVYIENPKFPEDPPEGAYGNCIGKCGCYLKFSNKNIPSIKIENCIGGKPVNEGDLNNDGTDEIGISPNWWSSLGEHYEVYTFKNGKWKYLVDPIPIHCNTCQENFKPIEKDPNYYGYVIIRYTEMSEEGNFILKTKSIKVD